MKELVKRPASVLAVSLSMMALGACSVFSGGGSGKAPDDRPITIPTPRSAADLNLPIDAYELSGEQYAQIQRASAFGLRDCMKRYGLEVRIPRISVPRYPKNASRLAWLGADDVEKYGYQGPPGATAEMLQASTRMGLPIAVPNDYTPVVEGTVRTYSSKPVPSGGCQAEVQRRLLGGTAGSAESEDLNTFHSQANSLARADKRFQQVVNAWSQCMADQGYKYKTLDEPAADPRWNAMLNNNEDGLGAASPLEIKTATADLKCREKTNVSGVLLALISANEKRIIETKGEVIREISDRLKRQLKNAEKIIAESN